MEEAKAKAVVVEAAVVAADAFAEKVGVEKANANVENEAAQVEADKCAVIAEEVGKKQSSCEADLAAAEPLVEQALKALDTLNKKDLGEAKSLKKPPQARHHQPPPPSPRPACAGPGARSLLQRAAWRRAAWRDARSLPPGAHRAWTTSRR